MSYVASFCLVNNSNINLWVNINNILWSLSMYGSLFPQIFNYKTGNKHNFNVPLDKTIK